MAGTDPGRALFFPTAPPGDWAAEADPDQPAVTKIVLGSLGGADGDAAEPGAPAGELPDDLASVFPKLTHLYLWNRPALRELPPLPPGLQCLDLRGCAGLEKLPDLPDGLSTLDLKGCSQISELPTPPKTLRELYLADCDGLDDAALIVFLKALPKESDTLVEFEGSGCAGVTPTVVKQLPGSLTKLVLRNCEALTGVGELARFAVLDHLDLQHCGALRDLPAPPASLRYLALHGSGVTSFRGQGVSETDRGVEAGENVLPFFHTREKFGDEIDVMPHAKLLLMGNGRVGKSTLAKRLQWQEMDGATRKGHPDLEPSENEPPNHLIQFWPWRTGLALEDERRGELEQQLRGTDTSLEFDAGGHLSAEIGIWDFGGQDIYHHTHRVFAQEGSIFVLVWRETPPEIGAIPDNMEGAVWKALNRQRPLDYWLDYIYAINPRARVVLACTKCQPEAPRPPWDEQIAERHRGRDLKAFFVDSIDGPFEAGGQFAGLVDWIRCAAALEADRLGIVQPRFFAEVASLAQELREAEKVFIAGAEWRDAILQRHRETMPDHAPPDETDIGVITAYLHGGGHLFQVGRGADAPVLLDQKWGTQRVYELLRPGSELSKTICSNGGWFTLTELDHSPYWSDSHIDDPQRERLLRFMEDCDLVVRLTRGRQRRSGGDEVFVATNKWLLPPFEELQQDLLRRFQVIEERKTRPTEVEDHFRFEDVRVSEFDFRTLFAHLARFFSDRAIYFRDGLQAEENDQQPDWCFRVRWQPDGGDENSYYGSVDGVLVAREGTKADVAQLIEEAFFDDGSPLATHAGALQRQRASEHDLQKAFFLPLRASDYDVGLSSRGADAAQAEQLRDALENAGLKVNWYRDSRCRDAEDARGVQAFMDTLAATDAIVLLVSDDYLSGDPESNWPCATEIADAICQLGEGVELHGGTRRKRPGSKTIVAFREGGGFTFDCNRFAERLENLLKGMEQHYIGKFDAKRTAADKRRFAHYRRLYELFGAARERGNWEQFVRPNGPVDRAVAHHDHAQIARTLHGS